MKKLIGFCFMVVFVNGVVCAKNYPAKDIIEFGGSASYMSTEHTSILLLAPEFNYFIKENISLGGVLEYTNIKDVDAVTAILLAPKYFFSVEKDNIYPYAGVLYNLQKDNNAFGISAGIKRDIFKKVLLNIGLQYLAGDVKETQFFAGFTLYCLKKK